MPTLVDGDKVITESTLICEYLDEAYPVPPLMPAGPLARAQARRWSKAVDEGLHDGIAEITFSARRDRLDKMTPDERQAFFNNVGDPRRHDRFKATYELGAQSPFLLYAISTFTNAFELLETSLEQTGPWIMGASPTLADIALAPYVSRLGFLGLLDLWTEDKPHVRAWQQHVELWSTYKTEILEPMQLEIAVMAEAGERFRPHWLMY